MDLTEDPRVVFKTSDVEDYGFDYSDYEFIRMDGLVSERLTAYDNIVDMYAFCGIAFVSEAMMDGELETAAVPLGGRKKVELNDKDGLDPRNNFTAEQKLQYGLEMAEAIAVLHSFPDGMIIHDDIQMTQFLFTPDGHLKLNDFNRAEVVLWNEEDQEYCKYRNYKGQGDVSYLIVRFCLILRRTIHPGTHSSPISCGANSMTHSGDHQKSTLIIL